MASSLDLLTPVYGWFIAGFDTADHKDATARAQPSRSLNMPRRTHTYAIRLAVEGGGQVKVELVSVGQSGELSLKRIESAGNEAASELVVL
jgi:hypothetical protein